LAIRGESDCIRSLVRNRFTKTIAE
jgi:hypothetical protein